MQENENQGFAIKQVASTSQSSEQGPKVVQTDKNAKDGQSKCPKCGATDISLNAKTGLLRCNYCRYEFSAKQLDGMVTNIYDLEGEVVGSGTQDIQQDTKNIVTLKCTSCGAEVVIDTTEETQARCHWCRNTLSINQQIPNGSIPDIVLPFKLTREEARKQIEEFVGKRKFFANPTFQKEFTTENVMGVYFPYMVIDANLHAIFSGKGEHEVRRYTVGSKNNRTTYYDADLYEVGRDFDLTIAGLTVESSMDKLDQKAKNKTNNIINSIMPFDTENSVSWNANYLKGYSSERRDTNINQLRPLVDEQIKDVARFAANETLQYYDRGVCWRQQDMDIKGKQWKAAYLPVWLYSYQEKKGEESILHYVAVNARTKETMGSVPIHIPKLIGMSVLVELLGIFAMAILDFEYDWLLLLSGFIYFYVMYKKYRNKDARHYHEKETNKKMYNLKSFDKVIKRERGLTSSTIQGMNNTNVNGKSISDNMLKTIIGNL